MMELVYGQGFLLRDEFISFNFRSSDQLVERE